MLTKCAELCLIDQDSNPMIRAQPPSPFVPQVTEVLYSEAGVKVVTADGAVLGGRRAIVTLPLGVLKAGDVSFSPALPRRKADAIRRLRVGLLDKARILGVM